MKQNNKAIKKINLGKNNTYRKKISIFLSLIVIVMTIVITSGVFLFGNKEEIKPTKMLAYIYDGEKHDAPPAKDSGYEIDVVNCDNAVGKWSNKDWNITLTEIEGKTNCVLNFKKSLAPHTLKIDPNGGTYNGTTGITSIDVRETNTYTLATPTREGYSFDRWEMNNETSQLDGNVFTMGTENTKVIAYWNINNYQVQVIETNLCDKVVTAEYNSAVSLCTPEKEGYTFAGWDITSGRVEGESFIVGASDAVVKPKWTIKSYGYIVYHKIEGLNGTYNIKDTETFNANYGTRVSPNTKNYTGFTAPQKQTITISPENNSITYNYTRNKYNLTINPNGGTTSTQSQELKYEQSIQIVSPVKRGYNFTGWTKTSGTLQDTLFTMGASNATLTANYTPKTLTVYFDANQGSVSTPSKQVVFDQTYGTLPTPTRTGYTFDGWYLNGNKIESTTKVDIDESVTLIAHWSKGAYRLSVNPNGGTYNGSTTTTTTSMDYEEEATISDPTRTGYTFNGWDVSGTGATYNSSTKVFKMGSSNATLTAKWTVNQYKLTIQDTGVCDGEYNLNYQQTYTLCTPMREGSTFTGWEDEDSLIQNNVVTMKAKDSTIKAKWTTNTYNYIVYHNKMNLDGETYTTVAADTVSSSATYGTVVTTLAKSYPGFGTLENIPITIGVTNNIVNYNYPRNKYTLTINPNGGTYSGTTSKQLYYEQQETLGTPTKEGYNFTGWSAVSGTISDNVFTMGAGNATVTANYQAKTYTVTFNPNGGSVTTTSKTVTYDQTYGTLPTPVKSESEFLGWYTDPTDGTKIESTTTVKLTENQTLYAHWKIDYAMFAYGGGVNVVMKQLAGNTSSDGNAILNSYNTNITAIERSSSIDTSKELANVSVSGQPIIMWYDNGKIKWYCDASKIYLNSDSDAMFVKFKNISSLDLTPFDSSNVTSMYITFGMMDNLSSINLSNFNTSSVTDMSFMFAGDKNLTSLNVSSFDTSNVETMESMFNGLNSLTNLSLGTFNTSNVTNMAGMFKGVGNLTSLNVSGFNTSKVTNMSYMFNGMNKLTSLNVSNFNTSKVTDMSYMFSEMGRITSLNASNFNTSNVTNMTGMFSQMENLTSLNVSGFNTSNVTRMGCIAVTDITPVSDTEATYSVSEVGMFSKMDSIQTLDISSFDTSKVQIMGCLFVNCENLKTIYVSNKWSTQSMTYGHIMFGNDQKIIGGSGTTYNYNTYKSGNNWLDADDSSYARIDGGTSSPGYFTYKAS